MDKHTQRQGFIASQEVPSLDYRVMFQCVQMLLATAKGTGYDITGWQVQLALPSDKRKTRQMVYAHLVFDGKSIGEVVLMKGASERDKHIFKLLLYGK